jgi:hypothetical protein
MMPALGAGGRWFKSDRPHSDKIIEMSKYPNSNELKQIMKTLWIEEGTYKRLTSVLEDVMHFTKKDVNYDDILNELIDVYQENVWGNIGGPVGGG